MGLLKCLLCYLKERRAYLKDLKQQEQSMIDYVNANDRDADTPYGVLRLRYTEDEIRGLKAKEACDKLDELKR